MPDYSKFTRDQLVEELKKRRSSGSKISVDLRSNEANLIAALELDDISGDNATPDGAETNRLDQEFIPGSLDNQLSLEPETPTEATQPSDEEFAKGFKARDKQGIVFQVIKVDSDDLKPYKARVPRQKSGHPGLYWEGSAEEFKAEFERV